MTEDVNNTDLHIAVLENDFDTLVDLLDEDTTDYDERNTHGETALLLSLKNNCNDEIVCTLIDYGCDVNIPDEKGVTPLHLAVERDTSLIVDALIENGADINAKDNIGLGGFTPLHRAVLASKLENVRTLLEDYNASINERDKLCGRTPYYWAIKVGNNDVSIYLLDYIVDVNERDSSDLLILHCALLENSIIALDLIEKGSDVNLLFGNVHSIYLALEMHSSSNVFEAIWKRTDISLLLNFEYKGESFLEHFVREAKYSDTDFLRCLEIIFESPRIGEFLKQLAASREETSLIYLIINKRQLNLEHRIKMVDIFLSNNVEIYYNDICILYETYGFDESLELLLKSGCYINSNTIESVQLNLIVSRITYDYFVNWEFLLTNEEDRRNYQRFYRRNMPSLVELTRNVVRKEMYKNWNTPDSFDVYKMLATLKVSSVIKDILFLKKPIYVSGN